MVERRCQIFAAEKADREASAGGADERLELELAAKSQSAKEIAARNRQLQQQLEELRAGASGKLPRADELEKLRQHNAELQAEVRAACNPFALVETGRGRGLDC